MRMRKRGTLWLAVLLLLAALLKLLLPGASVALRELAEDCLAPGGAETVEAWGRALAGGEERIAALNREEES